MSHVDLMRLGDLLSPVVMQDAPAGRGGDEPDGGRDRHDGLARLSAAELTERALWSRTLSLFSFRVTAAVATSLQRFGSGRRGEEARAPRRLEPRGVDFWMTA